MEIFDTLIGAIRPFTDSAIALVGLISVLWLAQRLLERRRAVTSGHVLAFDKAEMAETMESLRRSLSELVEQIKTLGDDDGEHRDRLERRRQRLEARIAAREAEVGDAAR